MYQGNSSDNRYPTGDQVNVHVHVYSPRSSHGQQMNFEPNTDANSPAASHQPLVQVQWGAQNKRWVYIAPKYGKVFFTLEYGLPFIEACENARKQEGKPFVVLDETKFDYRQQRNHSEIVTVSRRARTYKIERRDTREGKEGYAELQWKAVTDIINELNRCMQASDRSRDATTNRDRQCYNR